MIAWPSAPPIVCTVATAPHDPEMAAFARDSRDMGRGSSTLVTFGLAVGAGALLGSALVSVVSAQEYCVACSEPAAVYRCVIDGVNPGLGQPLTMVCLTRMAAEGGHASCAVRTGTVFECAGPIRRVRAAAVDPQPAGSTAQSGRAQPQNSRAADGAAGPPPTEPGAPKTVEEMAQRMAKSAPDDVSKAGNAISNAAKSSWRCLSSFFKAC